LLIALEVPVTSQLLDEFDAAPCGIALEALDVDRGDRETHFAAGLVEADVSKNVMTPPSWRVTPRLARSRLTPSHLDFQQRTLRRGALDCPEYSVSITSR
jgi:hypothetical protein